MEEILGLVGELPDLWDFISAPGRTTRSRSRFGHEGIQEQ